MIQSLHQSVTNSAAARPEAIACRCSSEQVTYAQLDQQSAQLANFLIGKGAVKGDRIGVFMPRCVETMIAVYGILKAGCVFVPIDPNLSAGGVATLIRDCEIRLLLTHPKKRRVLNLLVQKDCPLACLVGVDKLEKESAVSTFEWSAFANESMEDPSQGNVEPQDPAYIMYSSGSTGQPKGITHTHFSGLSYSRLSIATYDVTPDDVIANHSPISFDMSTFGYFTSCVAGATMVLIPEAHTKFPASLAGLIESERITIWYSVPLALIQLLLRTSLNKFDMTSIRWVKFGGEPFPPKYLRPLMKAWPQARFSNVYGPAEVNQCTFYHVPSAYADDENALPIPIGKVWDESAGLVVDDAGEIIEDDAAGELMISSPTMMCGYWNRPERSAASLREYAEDDGSRRVYYRTGDLVRRQPDGNLIFLGRKDRQIKIRGYRIELEEVESALNGLDAVQEAGVYCVKVGDEKFIHASAILNAGAHAEEELLKSGLAESLSTYAIPATIKLVEQLPRTVSGKIDRNQLAKEAESVNCNECK